MNWVTWTTGKLRALRSTTRVTDEHEMVRLVDGLEELQRSDAVQHQVIHAAPDDRACPCCKGKRCLAWRQGRHTVGCGGHGEDDDCKRTDADGQQLDGCGGEAEPIPAGMTFRQMIEVAFVNPGRHSIRYLAGHMVPWGWNPIPLRTRVTLWPTAYARKLGRPVQIGRFARFAVALP